MKYLARLDPASEFIALDVETTGRSAYLDVVAEIGAIRYKGGVEVERYVTLVKPATAMLPWITQLTGITDEMLAGAPSSSTVAREMVKFLRRSRTGDRASRGRRVPLVIHNAAFDVPILERFVSRHAVVRAVHPRGRFWTAPPVLCTLRLSRRLLPQLASRRLSALADYFDFTPRHVGRRFHFHRAGTDAEAAAHIFFCLSSMMSRTGGLRA